MSHSKMTWSSSIFLFFIFSLPAQQAHAIPIISLLEDNIVAETKAWVESEPGTPTWSSKYNGPVFSDLGDRIISQSISSLATPFGTIGNVAEIRVDSSTESLTLINMVADYWPTSYPDDFVGYAQAQTYLDLLFRIDEEDAGIRFDGFTSVGSAGYSIFDETAHSLIGARDFSGFGIGGAILGNFDLFQGHVYRMQINVNIKSPSDPVTPLLTFSFFDKDENPHSSPLIVRAVPEPASLTLLGFGLIELGFARKKQAQAA